MSSDQNATTVSTSCVILVVDDSWPERSRLKVILQRMGHKVFEDSDGQSGLEMFRAVQPNIVISDWLMPGMSGLQLCHALQQEHAQDTHVMLLTSRQATADVVAGMNAGADDFQTKPIATEELCARLQAVIRRRKFSSGHSNAL